MKRNRVVLTAIAVLCSTAAVVFATVTFDSISGTGFVGKGDVQTAFGWNNADAQNKMAGVTFAAETRELRAQRCVDQDGQETTDVGSRTGTRDLATQIAYNTRIHKQIDGIFLTGYSGEGVWSDWSEWIGPNGETFGDACPPNAHPVNAPVVTVDPTGAKLFAVYGGNSVQIWP